MHITDLVAELVLQIGIIVLMVRLSGRLVKKIGAPSVLGELLAGVLIGPYALGGIPLPGFPHGIFPLADGALAVSVELYAFATVASIVLLFASGLETDLSLFLRYSVAGGFVGIGGALLSFATGAFCSALLLESSIFDPRCLFLGAIACTTSVGISARTLSERKKMDSPEGVTILTAAVFDDVIWIILLAVVLGIVSILGEHSGNGISVSSILIMAGKVFGIWLGVTALFLLCSKLLASFLKMFKDSVDFTVLSLGIALVLAGLLEKQGLALIIGAYIAGLSLSKTDIAAVIQDRIRGLYTFFVPMFFAVMGMMVNVREIVNPQVLIFGVLFTLAVIFSKIIGCGGPALVLGFNYTGALRIGVGMIPRGEGALITCGIGLTIGVFDNRLFSVSIFMIFLTIVASSPLLGAMLKINRRGTKKPVKSHDSVHEQWKFETAEIADLVMDNLLKELRNCGFYVQMMNIDEGLSQARKDDIALFITKKQNTITIATSRTDMPFVKNEIYEVILNLSNIIQKLKDSADPAEMKKDLINSDARTTKDLLALIDPQCVTLDLKGETKKDVINELICLLANEGKLRNREQALADVLERESSMSTGMELGVALPHGKTEGADDTIVAVGIKKSGINFDSMDGQPSRIIILIVSPKTSVGLHVQFLAAIGAILLEEPLREALINAATPQEAADLLKTHKA